MTREEQISTIYASQMNHVLNLQVRFGGLDSLIWISAEMYQNAACDMAIFLEECGIPVEEAVEIAGKDFTFMDCEGLIRYCLKDGVVDWGKFGLITDLLRDHDEDKVEAALELGVDLEKFEDAYCTKANLRDYVIEEWQELNLHEIPPAVHNYLDYDAIYADNEADYCEYNNHIFRTSS